MLKVEDISTGYGKKQVLFDVSFEVNKGEIVLLVGSNGSGKSTLLKAIYGILQQWNNGQIFFDGENITGKPTSALLKKGLLYIPQKDNLFEHLLVKENLEMAGLTIEQKLLNQRIDNSLSIFKNLVPHLKRTPMKLSGGERQLLTLAMATLHQPKMILIDEPFSGLSPNNITFVAENLKILNQKSGITFLIIEHRVKESLLISNKVISLKLGRVFSKFELNESFNINELNLVFL
jgi:branched-chain amino acid transport system ATP-binding protein